MIAALIATLAAAAAGREDDPLRAAHDRRDVAHAMRLIRVESTIEMLHRNELQVFGQRREIACPSGALVAESACDPCLEAAAAAPERPAGEWLYEPSWKDDGERARALGELLHFSRYFELERAGGADRGGRTIQFYRYTGRKKPPPPPAVAARVEIVVEGRAATAAVIPAGATEVEVQARAFAKGETGSIEPMPEATIEWSATCGTTRSLGDPRRALFSLRPGVERCELKATALPGVATAVVGVTRAVKVEIVVQGSEPDEIVLDGEANAQFTFRATAAGQEVAIDPEWRVLDGAVELVRGEAAVRFRLDRGKTRGELLLLDKRSGASDRVIVRRP